jgi:hypothetical protein
VLDNASKKNSSPKNGAQSGNGNGHTGDSGASGRPLPLKGSYTPPDVENVDIFRLLDQLEELPEKAKHLPFNTLVGFDHEQFYYLVLKVRANLPEDMKKAQRVARDSERIVDEARDVATHQLESGRVEAGKLLEESKGEANRIIEQARVQAASMIDNSEVNKMATVQAHEIIRSAETEASEIRKGADEYAKDVLLNLEAVMNKAIATVQRGRETLDKARG